MQNLINSPNLPAQQDLTVEQMAALIAKNRVRYPHLSPNPLIGNTLF